MDDSFRVRADKVFGSLGGNTASLVGVSSSLWCLGEEEIERREWNRNKEYADEEEDGDLESGPLVVRNPLDSDLQNLSGDEDEEEEEEDEEIDGGKKKRRRNNSSSDLTSVHEYFDVQSSIGCDCTLDYEEEEDQYDKVAVGAEEQNGDRLYMRDVEIADYEIDELHEYVELPTTFQSVVRDPRANCTAAKSRLKEDDAEAAGNFDTLQLSDDSAAINPETEDLKKRELDGGNPKPILKKGENMMDSRSQKRVRFIVDPNSRTQTHEDQQALETCVREDCAVQEHAPDLSLYTSGIPDYLKNPSKYTCYAFDSSDDVDDQSNQEAYMEFLDNVSRRNSDSSMDDLPVETPKSLMFTPRRKAGEGLVGKMSESHRNSGDDNAKIKRWSVGMTAEEISQESEVSAMEEDEPCGEVGEGCSSSGKAGRQYRARINVDFDDN
ncbi:hypothetical protein OROHE_003577 [Orobanche hederae]